MESSSYLTHTRSPKIAKRPDSDTRPKRLTPCHGVPEIEWRIDRIHASTTPLPPHRRTRSYHSELAKGRLPDSLTPRLPDSRRPYGSPNGFDCRAFSRPATLSCPAIARDRFLSTSPNSRTAS